MIAFHGLRSSESVNYTGPNYYYIDRGLSANIFKTRLYITPFICIHIVIRQYTRKVM